MADRELQKVANMALLDDVTKGYHEMNGMANDKVDQLIEKLLNKQILSE